MAQQGAPVQQAPQRGSMQQSQPIQSGAVAPGGIREDIRALNSSILLIAQKIKYLVRNEKILGRNLVVLNKKIKTLEEKVIAGPQGNGEGISVSSEEITALTQKVALLEAQIEDLTARAALKEELKELKFVINSINPLEFATLSQVRDLIDKKMEQQKQKGK
jgi:vacuolar-type H+-ATPase subunit I/STV1